MVFVGGGDQAGFVRLVEEAGATRTLLVGIDVGKSEALALIADGRGDVLADPVVFTLDEPGVSALEAAIRGCCRQRSANLVRIGVEACGHYHRLLVHRPCDRPGGTPSTCRRARSTPPGRRWVIAG